ncbi:MAG: ATP-binding protein [Fidelibacterota bacterium]
MEKDIKYLTQPLLLLEKDIPVEINPVFQNFTGYKLSLLKNIIDNKLFFYDYVNPVDINELIKDSGTEIIWLKKSNGDFRRILLNVAKYKNDNQKTLLALTDLKSVKPLLPPELDLQTLFDHSPLGIIYFNQKLTLIRYNQRAQKLFQMERGKSYGLADIIPLQSLDFVKEKIDLATNTEQPQQVIVNCHNQMICKWDIYPLAKNGVIAYIEDISKIKQKEHQLYKEKNKVEANNLELKKSVKNAQKLAAEVSYANKSKAAFIANISHEIRTPLNAIMGFAGILSNELEQQQHLNFLNSIIKSGNTLLEIINNILDYSKLESGKREITNSEIKTHQFLNNLAQVYQSLSDQKGIKFSLEIAEDFPSYIELDQQLLSQIIRNLLDNAVKFTEKGRIWVTAESTKLDDDFVDIYITVSDTGTGIPKSQQKKIFHPFSQQDNQSHATYGGTGLGLSIVKKSVSLLSGELKMDSTPGKGTKFLVKLPHINRVNHKTEIKKAELEHIDISKLNFSNKTIVIADRTKFNRLLVKNILADFDITINEVSSIESLITFLENQNPSLLIINQSLLKEIEDFSAFDSLLNTKNIPVIILISDIDSLTHKMSNKDNCQTVYKPINKDTLLKSMATLIDYQTAEPAQRRTPKNILPKSMPKERIKRMLIFLEIEFLPKCKEYQENMIISNIEELCDDVAAVGEANNIWILNDWTKQLRSAIDNFEIHNIKQLLKEFPNIIQKINSFISDKPIN